MLRQATGIAKAAFVADFVRLLVESGEKVVLFSRYRNALDALKTGEFDAYLYMPDAMVVIDEDGLIRSFSQAAERLFGDLGPAVRSITHGDDVVFANDRGDEIALHGGKTHQEDARASELAGNVATRGSMRPPAVSGG